MADFTIREAGTTGVAFVEPRSCALCQMLDEKVLRLEARVALLEEKVALHERGLVGMADEDAVVTRSKQTF